MTLASARRRYVTDAVSTVNPHKLVVMLYDRLLLDISRAGEALEVRDYEVVNEQLVHAQDIVLELQSSLNVDVWSGGPVLMQLYTYLMTELVSANVAKDGERIEGCRKLVEPLADAWRNAAAQLADGMGAGTATAPGGATPAGAPAQPQPARHLAAVPQAAPASQPVQPTPTAPPGGFVG